MNRMLCRSLTLALLGAIVFSAQADAGLFAKLRARRCCQAKTTCQPTCNPAPVAECSSECAHPTPAPCPCSSTPRCQPGSNCRDEPASKFCSDCSGQVGLPPGVVGDIDQGVYYEESECFGNFPREMVKVDGKLECEDCDVQRKAETACCEAAYEKNIADGRSKELSQKALRRCMDTIAKRYAFCTGEIGLPQKIVDDIIEDRGSGDDGASSPKDILACEPYCQLADYGCSYYCSWGCCAGRAMECAMYCP